jgi:hypothetical protein
MVLFLETCTAEVSSGRIAQRFLADARRPARTPPSTFLFLPIQLSNSPEIMAIPLSGEPESRRSPRLPNTLGCLVTLSVRSFAGAPSRRGGRRAVVGLYRRRLTGLSTAERGKIPGHCTLWKAPLEAVESAVRPPVSCGPRRRTGATFLPRCSHRGKASVHSSNRRIDQGTLTHLASARIVDAARCDLRLAIWSP